MVIIYLTENLIFSNFAVILYNTEMSDVLVIIPTYNEIENISAILEKVMKYPDNFDVLVIDDNSPDGTADAVRKVMEQFPGRVFLEERTGKLGRAQPISMASNGP